MQSIQGGTDGQGAVFGGRAPAARVFRENGSLGIPFDHLCLRVTTGGQAWLVDVGFGDSFILPLVLDDPREQDDGRRRYRIEPDGDERILWAGSRRSYRFGLTPFALADFEPGRCYHTTSPASHFTTLRRTERGSATA